MCQTDWSRDFTDSWVRAWGPWAPMVAPWAPMMQMWAQTMSAWVPGAAEMASQWMSPALWMGNTWGAPHVTTSVASRDPASVVVHLSPGAAGRELSAGSFERRGEGAGSFTGAALESDARENRVRVTVIVPDGQAPGTYRATVRDRCGVEQGQIVVEIRGPTPTEATD